MFRRNRRRERGGLFARLIVSPKLIEANRLVQAGEYAAAAVLYEPLAQNARRPRNAARLQVEAGRARLMAGQVAQAMPLFRQGLGLLAERGRWLTVHRLGREVVQDLRSRGHEQQANEIAAWLNGQPAPEQETASFPGETPPASVQAKRPPRLPTRCPACGAPVDPRDVEWVDEATVECDYCGSLIRAEEE